MISGRKWRRARRSSRISAGSLCSAENSRRNPRLAECVRRMDISCHPGARPGIHGHLVIIGHVGVATDLTAGGSVTGPGGSGFAAAFAAAALLSGTGLVAQVGEDFDLGVLSALGIGMEGISVLPGASARFRIEQPRGGSLSFTSDLGVAAEP